MKLHTYIHKTVLAHRGTVCERHLLFVNRLWQRTHGFSVYLPMPACWEDETLGHAPPTQTSFTRPVTRYVTLISDSVVDLLGQIGYLQAEGWKPTAKEPKPDGRLLFMHMEKTFRVIS